MSMEARRVTGRVAYAVLFGILALGVSLPAHAGGGQGAAGRLDSITPRAAAPGERVVITGRGLGARNVRVTVGDAPAQVVTATGNSATFVVPRSARIGATTVAATNPGGQTGSIGFHVLPAVQLDATAAITKVVDENGGVLARRRNGVTYTLTIPADALTAPAQITMTPVVSMANLPFSGAVHAAVRFEPSGLELLLPATLEITVDRSIDPSGLFGFQLDEGGTRLDVRPLALGGTTLTLRVMHFSYGGGATGTLADFESQVRPALNALPAVASPQQAESLISMVVTWIGMFGFDV